MRCPVSHGMNLLFERRSTPDHRRLSALARETTRYPIKDGNDNDYTSWLAHITVEINHHFADLSWIDFEQITHPTVSFREGGKARRWLRSANGETSRCRRREQMDRRTIFASLLWLKEEHSYKVIIKVCACYLTSRSFILVSKMDSIMESIVLVRTEISCTIGEQRNRSYLGLDMMTQQKRKNDAQPSMYTLSPRGHDQDYPFVYPWLWLFLFSTSFILWLEKIQRQHHSIYAFARERERKSVSHRLAQVDSLFRSEKRLKRAM